MECSICLETINDNEDFKLSCDHKLHFRCFLSLIIKTNCTIFTNCPLCRTININNKRPSDNTIENLNLFTKISRCSCITKNGKKCKKKSSYMNNGMCKIHNKETIQSDKYNLIEDFIFYLLETQNTIKTKIYMIDIAKKLILNNPSIKKIQDILHYFFRYYYINGKDKIVRYQDMYDYYNLKLPPENWIDNCVKENIIF